MVGSWDEQGSWSVSDLSCEYTLWNIAVSWVTDALWCSLCTLSQMSSADRYWVAAVSQGLRRVPVRCRGDHTGYRGKPVTLVQCDRHSSGNLGKWCRAERVHRLHLQSQRGLSKAAAFLRLTDHKGCLYASVKWCGQQSGTGEVCHFVFKCGAFVIFKR